jgi:hypothetical protein
LPLAGAWDPFSREHRRSTELFGIFNNTLILQPNRLKDETYPGQVGRMSTGPARIDSLTNRHLSD